MEKRLLAKAQDGFSQGHGLNMSEEQMGGGNPAQRTPFTLLRCGRRVIGAMM